MFRGVSTINMDAKSRVAIPARHRGQISDESNNKLVVTIDTESRCLLLYPFPEWKKIEEKLEALPSFDRRARRIQRLLLGHATEVELDKSGRLILSQTLCDYAGLEKEVALVGQGKKFEIWSAKTWNEETDKWLEEESKSDGGDLPEDLQSISL